MIYVHVNIVFKLLKSFKIMLIRFRLSYTCVIWKWIPVTSEQHLKLLYYDTQRQINSSIRQSWIKITYKHNQNNTSFTICNLYSPFKEQTQNILR